MEEKTKKYESILEKITYMKNKIDSEEINELQAYSQEIIILMNEEYGEDNINNMANLTLLDKNTNSRIGNNFFDTKRKKIIELEKNGEFIPICTKNVFLKFYSKNPNNIYFWTNADRKEYKEELETTLKEFIKSGEEYYGE